MNLFEVYIDPDVTWLTKIVGRTVLDVNALILIALIWTALNFNCFVLKLKFRKLYYFLGQFLNVFGYVMISDLAACRRRPYRFEVVNIVDESTDVAHCFHLLVNCRVVNSTSKASDFLFAIKIFFDQNGLSWKNSVGECTDSVPAMLGLRSGL